MSLSQLAAATGGSGIRKKQQNRGANSPVSIPCHFAPIVAIPLTIPWMPAAGVAQVAVENSIASSWTTVTEWKLEEDLRLWGPPGGYFGTIGSLAADSRDNIYVLDASSQEIQVFDSEGAFLRNPRGRGRRTGRIPVRCRAGRGSRRHRLGGRRHVAPVLDLRARRDLPEDEDPANQPRPVTGTMHLRA